MLAAFATLAGEGALVAQTGVNAQGAMMAAQKRGAEWHLLTPVRQQGRGALRLLTLFIYCQLMGQETLPEMPEESPVPPAPIIIKPPE